MMTLIYTVMIMLMACSSTTEPLSLPAITDVDPVAETQGNLGTSARVTDVTVSGDANNYSFSVTIASPDTGCDQYADWWEVFAEDGTLIYRRILLHSHVTEQPFTRSGGRVNIGPEDVVYVRAHMNNSGYGTDVYRGTVADGFVPDTLEPDHAEQLANEDPLPAGCAF